MNSMDQFKKNMKIYEQKRGDVEKRIEEEFIDHGIATIPCNVSDMSDIISGYSVPGYETIDSGFVEYVSDIVDFIPEQYPVVLSIVGKKFTKEEQEIIKGTLECDTAYALGAVEKEYKHNIKMRWFMVAGIIVGAILLKVFDWWSTIPNEMLFIIYWFFGDRFFDYVLIEGREIKKDRIRAARLACLSVEFAEEFDDSDYSDEEAKEIFDKLHKGAETD